MSMGSVITGDPSTMMAAMFARPPAETMNSITNQITSYIDTATNNSFGVNNAMLSGVIDQYNQYTSGAMFNKIDAMRAKLGAIWQTDTVRRLSNRESIQQAPLEMRKYVMAQPSIRTLYKAGHLEAYDGKYVDQHPNDMLGTNYDQRRVMDGVTTITDDVCHTSHYIEEDYNVGDMLNTIQRANIISTWRTIDKILAKGDKVDPTSTWNSRIS